jgi:MAP3K TRAFs-binding domain
MNRSICFVIMPFGKKADASGREIDFDRVYSTIIAPAIEIVGFDAVRADEEMNAGLIHKAMYERLILSEYAIADLTILNANVYYELGIRHAARPQTTVLLSAEASRLPFDVGHLRALPYALDKMGRPMDVEGARAKLVELLDHCKTHDEPDSPLFTLLDGFTAPQVNHEKTDLFRRSVAYSRELKERLLQARGKGVAALDAVRDELKDIGATEAGVVIDLLLSYRAIEAWDRMIDLYRRMDPVLAHSAMPREQFAFALNRAGRGEEAERVLIDLIASRGPSSESYGLLGRVYKDRWQTAKDADDSILARGAIKKAIDAYLMGFEVDWRDAYPGVNALTLMTLNNPADKRIATLAPVVRFAVERKMARGMPDYWDYATLLELAVMAGDFAEALDRLGDALAELCEPWEARTTARNLTLIKEARNRAGEDIAALTAMIESLEKRAGALGSKQ